MEMVQKLDVGLLHHVLGILVMPQKDECESIDRSPVLLEEPKRLLPPVVL